MNQVLTARHHFRIAPELICDKLSLNQGWESGIMHSREVNLKMSCTAISFLNFRLLSWNSGFTKFIHSSQVPAVLNIESPCVLKCLNIENAKNYFLPRYFQAGSLVKFRTDCVKNKIDNCQPYKSTKQSGPSKFC